MEMSENPYELTERHCNIPYAVAARYAKRGTERYDELVSFCSLELVVARDRFDPDRLGPEHSNFGSYLVWRTNYGAIRYLDRLGKGKDTRDRFRMVLQTDLAEGTWRKHSGPYTPYNHWADDAASGIRTAMPDTSLDDRDFADFHLSMLEPRDREMYVLYHRDGLTYRELGERYGVSKERVRQIVSRCQELLEFCREEL